MKSWKTLAAPLAGLVLLTSACTGETTGEDPAATPATAEVAEPETTSPTPTEESASVEQWASLVAKARNSYDDTEASWEEAICSPTTAAKGAVDCQAMMLTMGMIGEDASITFWGATNPDGETYMGEPPAEIADLVAETATAADDVSIASGEVDMDCFDGDCVSEAFELHRAWSALGEVYAAWEPYL